MTDLVTFTTGTLANPDDVNSNFTLVKDLADVFGLPFSQNDATTAGLVFGFYGGITRNNNTFGTIADGTLTLTDASTNYIEVDPVASTISSNTSGFTTGKVGLFIVVTASGAITSITDNRTWMSLGGGGSGGGSADGSGVASLSVAGSSDITLTAAQSQNGNLIFTGVLTGDINVIVYGTSQRAWRVYNDTTGAYTLTVKTSAGTGVAITAGTPQFLECDGTDVVAIPTGADGADGAGYAGTSTTSLTPATGSTVFTTQAGLAYVVGSQVAAISQSDSANFMQGLVTAYSGTSLTVNVTEFGGTTADDWAFTIAATNGTNGTNGAGYYATSTTSVEIATGDQTFTTQAGLAYVAGAPIKVLSQSDLDNFMQGTVYSYSGTTLIVSVTKIGGSGTADDWVFTVAGTDGAAGSDAVINPTGAWVTSTAYALLDSVSDGGSSYVCLSGHTSGDTTEPGVGADWTGKWQLLAAIGATGATGAAGTNGTNGTDGAQVIQIDSITSSATPGVDVDTYNVLEITALAESATFAAPTGTPDDGQLLEMRITDNATPQDLSWDTIYNAANNNDLPTATLGGPPLYLLFSWNAATSKWDLIASPAGDDGGGAWGSITGTLSDQTDLGTALGLKEVTSNKATDFTTLNDTLYPSVQAVQNAITTAVAGLLDYRGAYDASGNTYPSSGGSGLIGAILAGDFWICSVAGTLNSELVTAGDLIIAKVDTPSTTDANWDIISHTLTYVAANDSAVVHNTGAETVAGVKTFSSSPVVPTPTTGDSSTNAASTAFVGTAIAAQNSATATLTNKNLTDSSNTFPTLNQSTTGNSATATKLATARNINGTAFDGSSSITISAAPNGSAGGDLYGSYPSPSVVNINGTSVPATPTSGQVLTATGGTTATWQTRQLIIAGGFTGLPTASAIVGHFITTTAFTLPSGLTGSAWNNGTNPTATTVFTINKNGSSIGSMSISTSGVVTFTFTSGVSFAAGDILTVVAPATPDTTLADGAFSFLGSY